MDACQPDTGQSRLSAELLALLAERGDAQSYAQGDKVMTEGEVSDALYILVSGELKVFTQDTKGRELVYNILKPGELFGELTLDGGSRSASVKAIIPSKCVVIERDAMQGFMLSYPEFAMCLVMKLISRLRHATRQIKSLGLDDIYERVVALLNELSVPNERGRIVTVALTQLEISTRVAATREMVNHVLMDLVRGGYILKDKNNHMVILKELPRHR